MKLQDSGPLRAAPAGGAFIGTSAAANAAPFTPEMLPPDAQTMARAVEEFTRSAMGRSTDRVESPEYMQQLLGEAGELGLLGMAVPAEYGGLDLPKSELALVIEKTAIYPSFSISCGVHGGVATLPILFFGTEGQKSKWLPRLASGEAIGAFALSESESGSDALAAKTKAVLQPDNSSFLVNGSKMWITNAAFANLFVLFAQVEGAGFTAFLLEVGTPGLTIEREERKMGLKSSSTCRLTLDNVSIPADCILGEPGKGHYAALHCLNLGRLAIAASALGMSKECLRIATQYAASRRQFGAPIGTFGLIREKLARMTTRILALESMLYRTAGYLDIQFAAATNPAPNHKVDYRTAALEYAIECAILKFMGTETADFVIDEALQIHGGNGFSDEFAISHYYRDVRVFRIFEGTNEINRLTVMDQYLRRRKDGRLPLSCEIEGLIDFNSCPPLPMQRRWPKPSAARVNDPLETNITAIRRMTLAAIEFVVRAEESNILRGQQVSARVADMIGELYACDSLKMRCDAQTRERSGMRSAAQAYLSEAMMHCWQLFEEILSAACGDGDAATYIQQWRTMQGAPQPLKLQLYAEIATVTSEAGGYPW